MGRADNHFIPSTQSSRRRVRRISMPSTALVAKEIQVQSGLGEQIMANKGSKYKNTKEQKEIFFPAD